MIDLKLIEQRLSDTLDKETTETLLDWLKNHDPKQPEQLEATLSTCGNYIDYKHLKNEEIKKILINNYKKNGNKSCIGSVEKVVDELFDGLSELSMIQMKEVFNSKQEKRFLIWLTMQEKIQLVDYNWYWIDDDDAAYKPLEYEEILSLYNESLRT